MTKMPTNNTVPVQYYLNELWHGVKSLKADGGRTPNAINALKVRLRIFERWILLEYAELIPNEKVIEDFAEALRTGQVTKGNGQPYGKSLIKEAPSAVRRLHNICAETSKILQPLLRRDTFKSKRRFEKMTPKSLQLIEDYRKNGTRAESDSNKNHGGKKALKATTKRSAIDDAERLLREIRDIDESVQGLEDITREHIDQFIGVEPDTHSDHYRSFIRRVRMCHHTKTLFRHSVEAELFTHDPVAHVSNNIFEAASRQCYVVEAEVAKVLDLDTVDEHSFTAVRDRLICLVIYDTAIRRHECQSIRLESVGRDASGGIEFYTSKRKGSGQQRKRFSLLFSETEELFGYYLSRYRRKLPGGQLFCKADGTPLAVATITERVKRECERIGAVNSHGITIRPHDLRRAFATLNIEPNGLCLPPHEVAARLGDELSTVERHYVQNNPIAEAARASERRNRGSERTILNRVLNEVQTINRSGKLAEVEATIKNALAGIEAEVADERTIEWISEEEALELMFEAWGRAVEFSPRQFRQAMRDLGIAQSIPGMPLEYDRQRVETVAADYRPLPNWVPDLMRQRPSFDDMVKAIKGTIKIGRIKLVPTADYLKLADQR